MTRLEAAVQIAAAIATNADDTSPAGLARIAVAAVTLADELIAAAEPAE